METNKTTISFFYELKGNTWVHKRPKIYLIFFICVFFDAGSGSEVRFLRPGLVFKL